MKFKDHILEWGWGYKLSLGRNECLNSILGGVRGKKNSSEYLNQFNGPVPPGRTPRLQMWHGSRELQNKHYIHVLSF